jgi:hypothetical protein
LGAQKGIVAIMTENNAHLTAEEEVLLEIQHYVDVMNRRVGFPDGTKKYEISPEGKHTARPGFFHTLSDYGGISVVRVITYGGGVRAILGGYHKPQEALAMIRGFIKGWDEKDIVLEDYVKNAELHEKEQDHIDMARASM